MAVLLDKISWRLLARVPRRGGLWGLEGSAVAEVGRIESERRMNDSATDAGAVGVQGMW